MTIIAGLRTGLPEVIYAGGKTAAQVGEIFFRMAAMGGDVLATRADEAAFAAVKALVPEAQYHPCCPRDRSTPDTRPTAAKAAGSLAVLCAGTSDLPVAEEAAVTAEVMGAEVRRIYDVGVAGLHRLLAHREVLREAEVVIVCAGMEGALPSVVGGMVGAPGDCRSHQRGLRRVVWRHRSPAGNAEFLLAQRNGGQHR